MVLRRTDNSCTYGLQYLTHQRQLEDSELVEMAKNMDESNPFGESEAFYKLFNTA